ncbi:MAG: magnesium and cobalt exporter, family [Blastocatellia bacterium]|jgi:CBS domain containing-hemolysin-like protein|nr:magnesium and cobalt exporter, family [Blastocatellia bacterium]
MFSVLGIIAVFLLVLANGFFVASEFALVGVRRSRVATLAEAGDARAQRLLRLVDNLNAYISATQLGITLASLALGWIGEPAIARLLEGPLEGRVSQGMLDTIAFAVAFITITFLHIVLGELAPKTLALERAEKVALAIAWPMELFYKTFRLPIRLLDWAGTRTVRLFGLHPSAEHGSIYTSEELQQLVDASHQSGHLAPGARRLINSIFAFSVAEVREAMIPRTNVVALPATATLDEAEKVFCETGYSRLPVFRERLDNIVGVLLMKDLVPCLRKAAEDFQLERLLHSPMFVPATARLGPVLGQMQAAQSHIAFVVDEHGGIEGLVTLEDLLEEIVGEINDEYDSEALAQVVREESGAYVLDGMLAVRDANRRFNLRLPEEASYTTLAGFLLAKAGRLLRQGESIEHDGARFTVERIDRRRIRSIRFQPAGAAGTPGVKALTTPKVKA